MTYAQHSQCLGRLSRHRTNNGHMDTSTYAENCTLKKNCVYHSNEFGIPSKHIAIGQRIQKKTDSWQNIFPERVNLNTALIKVRNNCLICQSCNPTTRPLVGPFTYTVIPPRVMVSVTLDVGSMPEVEYRGKKYDAFLLCVDRLSGWIVARPTNHTGLTGEEAAHLMLDSSWGEFGVPSIVTADQGAQFISQYWTTMCARLGIRQAYSQAHRPQANGRAEVACRIIKDTLRKLLNDKPHLNWVEALPRALRIYHDLPDHATNMSPYQMMFGRERSNAGLPWEPEKVHEDAQDFLNRMAETDQYLAEHSTRHTQRPRKNATRTNESLTLSRSMTGYL